MVSFQNYAGITGLKSRPSSIPSFLKNGKQSTCWFVFAIFCMVGGSLSSPVIRHSFVRGGPTARSSAGPVGAFLPHRPYSSAIPAWFLPWESYPPQPEYGRCPCSGSVWGSSRCTRRTPHKHTDRLTTFRPCDRPQARPAGQRRAHMPQQMHTSMSLTMCPRRRSGAASFSCG